MGYETSMTGRITITPALTWQDIKNNKHFGDGLNGWPKHPDLVFEIETEGREMPEGILVVERAVAVIPASHYYPTSGEYAEGELEALVEQFGQWHAFDGTIEGFGEGDGTVERIDLWRLKVVAGAIVKFTPEIVWPKGSE
jgi:hypothetical protein